MAERKELFNLPLLSCRVQSERILYRLVCIAMQCELAAIGTDV